MQVQKVMDTRTSAAAARTAVLVSADVEFRQRLATTLTGLRWKVWEAAGGAEALWCLEENRSEALLLDSWLPDLDAEDLAEQIRTQYPAMDLIRVNETEKAAPKTTSLRRNELLHALRYAQEQEEGDPGKVQAIAPVLREAAREERPVPAVRTVAIDDRTATSDEIETEGLLGSSPAMRALGRSIRLVAPHRTTVLIEGPTGSGKEVVAQALHQMSPRASRPLVVVNCAAIPEALLEAELFGHTRGAFTGAVQARAGRIEAAHKSTLLLDEIGEMPLGVQAKLLRFLEAGELQRIGENQPVRVDVRVIAATHQPLSRRVAEGTFRADLYFRLAVFPLQTPALAERPEDIPMLAEHFLRQLAGEGAAKRLNADSVEKLRTHTWPGNVRELAHVMERAFILSEDRGEIGPEEIWFP